MDRRNFIKASIGAAVAAQMPLGSVAQTQKAQIARKVSEMKKLSLRSVRIATGIAKPFSALHLSDSHLTFADTRDDERKWKLAAGRQRIFLRAEHYLNEAITFANRHEMPILHTGDLIDFVSEANLDMVAAHFQQADWFVAAGNHEYSQYVGEALEDAAYRAASFDKVQAAYPNDLTCASRVINGLNLVSLDNGYYQVTEQQHQFVMEQVKKGLPIVLMVHVPFYTPQQCALGLKQTNGLCAYLAGVPLEITSKYDPNFKGTEQWRNRGVQQRATKSTLDFVAWLKEQPLLKGILAGHCHYYFQEQFSPTCVQYTVAAGYTGQAQVVQFC